jgi:hypothetical protein
MDESPDAVPMDQANFIQSILNFFRSVMNVFNYIIEQVGLKFEIDHYQFAFILVLLGAFFMVLPVFSDAELRTRVRRLTPQSRK